MPKLPENAFDLASNHLHFSLTSFPELKNNIIGRWTNKQDLLDGILASAFIPIFDTWKLTPRFRGYHYIDGFLTNSCPQPLGNDVPTCVIRRNMCRTNNASWLWCWSDEA
eukprot:gene8086-761_t